MATFTLEIMTPYRQFFSGEAEALVFTIPDGEYGVQAGHAPTVTVVVPCTLHYKVDGEWRTAAVTSGIAEVMPEYTILLVAAAEHPDEIDLTRAEAARLRAEERLRYQGSMQDHLSAQAALSRAMARLKTRKHH